MNSQHSTGNGISHFDNGTITGNGLPISSTGKLRILVLTHRSQNNESVTETIFLSSKMAG